MRAEIFYQRKKLWNSKHQTWGQLRLEQKFLLTFLRIFCVKYFSIIKYEAKIPRKFANCEMKAKKVWVKVWCYDSAFLEFFIDKKILLNLPSRHLFYIEIYDKKLNSRKFSNRPWSKALELCFWIFYCFMIQQRFAKSRWPEHIRSNEARRDDWPFENLFAQNLDPNSKKLDEL